jgi:hypothetical protein
MITVLAQPDGGYGPTAAPQPSPRLRSFSTPDAWPFVRHAGWLSITAGVVFLIAQTVMWTFGQRMNPETSQNPVFIAAKIVLLAGFVVLMFALIAVHGLQAQQAGRLGIGAFSVAIVGTMMLAGDLWSESFAVPWLAGARTGKSDRQAVSDIRTGRHRRLFPLRRRMDLVRHREPAGCVFPLALSIGVIIGGLAGYQALLAPWAIPLGLAIAALGIWIVRWVPAITIF